jgi:hypothetical protein
MKAATINEIKSELIQLPAEKLSALCLRLAKFKKENKELLTFLLFEADDLTAYIMHVKQEMDGQFDTINTASVYFVKKSLRKILRITNKYIRYSGSGIAETELLLYFCQNVKQMDEAIKKNLVIANIFQNQVKKLRSALASLHEDLQYEYRKEMESLG